jgi:hypothetical protein
MGVGSMATACRACVLLRCEPARWLEARAGAGAPSTLSTHMVVVAHLARASHCECEGSRFEPGRSPQPLAHVAQRPKALRCLRRDQGFESPRARHRALRLAARTPAPQAGDTSSSLVGHASLRSHRERRLPRRSPQGEGGPLPRATARQATFTGRSEVQILAPRPAFARAAAKAAAPEPAGRRRVCCASSGSASRSHHQEGDVSCHAMATTYRARR